MPIVFLRLAVVAFLSGAMTPRFGAAADSAPELTAEMAEDVIDAVAQLMPFSMDAGEKGTSLHNG